MGRYSKYGKLYAKYGYVDRYEYFDRLSQLFNVPIMKIILKAEKLGIKEDFQGLVDWVYEESQNAIRQESNKEIK